MLYGFRPVLFRLISSYGREILSFASHPEARKLLVSRPNSSTIGTAQSVRFAE